MDGIRIVLVVVACLALLYNFFINFALIMKLVKYCFATGTLNQYWDLFLKNGMSSRAIISSVLGFVLALVVFIIILPFVLLKAATLRKKVEQQQTQGLQLDYSDLDFGENNSLKFNSNLNQIGLEIEAQDVTGKLRVDAIMIIAALSKKAEDLGKEISYEAVQEFALKDGTKAVVPIVLTMENTKYPIYILYTEQHLAQYKTVRDALMQSGYSKVLYFAVDSLTI